ncbi:hypothetical protein Hte_004477 [Hypoxylon texense]
MGGLAFSSGATPLYTPRMPPSVYNHVLSSCCAKLQELYAVVAAPIPGPAKTDHGDIDIMMALERNAMKSPSSSDALLSAAAHLLNAERSITTTPRAMNIAIAWPNNVPEEIASSYTKGHDDATKPRYIQVDLHHCDSLQQLQWVLFRNSHGDMWNILGSIIRPFSLTVDGVGLYIRIPEIEPLNRKQAKVLLTSDPGETLDFLGLRQYPALPFASVEDLFEYAAECRLMRVRPLSEEENDNDVKNDDNPGHATAEGGKIQTSTLKSRDRRTMIQRPVYRKWLDEFIPACRDAGRFATQSATQHSVRQEAFERFPGAQRAYETRLSDWRQEQQRQTLFRGVIKPSIPASGPKEEEERSPADQHWRSNAAGALKNIVLRGDYSLGIYPAAPLRDGSGLYDEDEVRRFVADNWERVGRAAWEQLQGRRAEKLAAQKGDA